MSKVLMRKIETWRVDTEAEADEIINNAANGEGELTKHTIEHKTKKVKKQIVDENYKVTIQLDYAPQFDDAEEEE